MFEDVMLLGCTYMLPEKFAAIWQETFIKPPWEMEVCIAISL